jgi:hypothetical protein
MKIILTLKTCYVAAIMATVQPAYADEECWSEQGVSKGLTCECPAGMGKMAYPFTAQQKAELFSNGAVGCKPFLPENSRNCTWYFICKPTMNSHTEANKIKESKSDTSDPNQCLREAWRRPPKNNSITGLYRIQIENRCKKSIHIIVNSCYSRKGCENQNDYIPSLSKIVIDSFIRYPEWKLK